MMFTRTPFLLSAILNESLHTDKAKNGRNYVIFIALFGLFSQGTIKNRIKKLVTEYRKTLAILLSHRDCKTHDFQGSKSFLCRWTELTPLVCGDAAW